MTVDVAYAIQQLRRAQHAYNSGLCPMDAVQRAMDALERVQEALEADQEPCPHGCPCSMCLETVADDSHDNLSGAERDEETKRMFPTTSALWCKPDLTPPLCDQCGVRHL